MSGNTKLIAEKIAGDLNADLIEIFPENSYPDKGFRKYFWGGKSAVMGDKPKLMPYEFSADKYDTIVFGTPVWAATFTPPIRTFIEENKAELSGGRAGHPGKWRKGLYQDNQQLLREQGIRTIYGAAER